MALNKVLFVLLVAVATAIIAFILLRMNGYDAGVGAFVIALLMFSAGLPWALKKDKEGFSALPAGDGQTINIVQNCGGSAPAPPGPAPPAPPGPAPLSDKDVRNWVKSINPALTGECQDCVVEHALKMWSADTLAQVKQEPKAKQEVILNAMLAFDCSKQCVLPPSGLNAAEVDQWLHTLEPKLAPACHACLVKIILKLWTVADYNRLQKLEKDQQMGVIQGLLAFNCPNCDLPNNLSLDEVVQWMSGLLTGATQDCYKCGASVILRLWSTQDFAKVKKLSKKSQLQVLQSLMALNCDKVCVAVPSGLTPADLEPWLASILIGNELKGCADSCIVPALVRIWTPAMFAAVKAKPFAEQQVILQGVIAIYCKDACLGGPLTQDQIRYWVGTIIPSLSDACATCIADTAMDKWSGDDFQKVLGMPVPDQIKIARAMAAFNCPHVCQIPPAQEWNYIPY